MFILILSLLTGSAHAQDKGYFKIKKVKQSVSVSEDMEFTDSTIEHLKLVEKVITEPTPVPELPPFPTGGDPELSIMDTLFKIWDIVKENKPVVSTDTDRFATALPEIAKENWSRVGGWMPERNIMVQNSYINLYGMEVVRFDYQVKLIYGGNVNGKGLYIASARVIPTKVDVAWGYTLNVVTTIPVVMNVRTPDNPLAAIQMHINYTVETILKRETTTDSYQVQGNGMILNTKTNKVLASPVLRMRLR